MKIKLGAAFYYTMYHQNGLYNLLVNDRSQNSTPLQKAVEKPELIRIVRSDRRGIAFTYHVCIPLHMHIIAPKKSSK
jgi:hypothetical protein